jgi:hypothetical protein
MAGVTGSSQERINPFRKARDSWKVMVYDIAYRLHMIPGPAICKSIERLVSQVSYP